MNRNPSELSAAAAVSSRSSAPQTPRPPRWAVDPCRHGHCTLRGTVHPEPYHIARDGSHFDRMP